MPNYFPATSGVWSNLSNWLTAAGSPAGILPTFSDDVYSNDKVVYIDGNFNVNSIRNLSAANISAGGYFIANNGISLSAYVVGGGVSDVACLQFLSGAGTSATLFGSLCAGSFQSQVLRPVAFRNVSSGTFNIIGNCDGGINNNQNANFSVETNGIIINSGSGVLNLSGRFFGDIGPSPDARNLVGIRNQSSGTIILRGNILGGTGTGSYGLANLGTGNVFVSGTSTGGSGAAGIFNDNSAVVYVVRAKGSDSSLAEGVINNGTFSRFFAEEFEFGKEGCSPVAGTVFLIQKVNSVTIMKTEPFAFNNVVLFNSLSTQGLMPPVSSVRSGVVYGDNQFVGTMIIPPASAVQVGIPLDDTIGSYVFNPEQFWQYPRSSIKTPNTIGYRVANLATIASVGQLIGSFNLSPPQSAFNIL